MGDKQNSFFRGFSIAFPQLQQKLLQDRTVLRINCTEGFVHQQDIGIHGQGTGNGHALLHTA